MNLFLNRLRIYFPSTTTTTMAFIFRHSTTHSGKFPFFTNDFFWIDYAYISFPPPLPPWHSLFDTPLRILDLAIHWQPHYMFSSPIIHFHRSGFIGFSELLYFFTLSSYCHGVNVRLVTLWCLYATIPGLLLVNPLLCLLVAFSGCIVLCLLRSHRF